MKAMKNTMKKTMKAMKTRKANVTTRIKVIPPTGQCREGHSWMADLEVRDPTGNVVHAHYEPIEPQSMCKAAMPAAAKAIGVRVRRESYPVNHVIRILIRPLPDVGA